MFKKKAARESKELNNSESNSNADGGLEKNNGEESQSSKNVQLKNNRFSQLLNRETPVIAEVSEAEENNMT